MSSFRRWLPWLLPTARGLSRQARLSPGLYHFQRERDGQYIRYHLRVEGQGHGLLIAAASEAVRLSPLGAAIAHGLLSDRSTAEVAATLGLKPTSEAIVQVERVVRELGRPSARFPIFNLADPAASDQPVDLMAPFQADLEVAAASTLCAILDRLWTAGIPHARFLLQDEGDEEHAIAAVQHAEDIGMIAGARFPKAAAASASRIEKLAAVGLDYVVLPWAVCDPVHDAIYGAGDYARFPQAVRDVQRCEMTAVAQIPLIQQTEAALEDNLDELIQRGVAHAEVFAVAVPDAAEEQLEADPWQPLAAAELRQVATRLEELADQRGLQLIWLPPQAIRSGEPMLQRLRSGPRAGGDVSIRVPANGDVIPPRGPRQVAGNLLAQPWPAIWNHPAFARYRRRVESPERCEQCPGLAICAAMCPADPAGWAED
jgi:radical SAM protein with 4Fe4S-binding SPASM domain